MVDGAPAGLVFRPPFISPSPTSGASVRTTLRSFSGLIYSRTRHRSVSAAGTPGTPTDYGFGRRTSTTAVSRPTPTHRRPPTLTPRPLLRRPSTARRSAAQDSPSPVTPTSTTSPVLPPSLQPTTPRPPPPAPPTPLPRLPKPVVERKYDQHLISCVDHYTYTGWAREQRAGPLCYATL